MCNFINIQDKVNKVSLLRSTKFAKDYAKSIEAIFNLKDNLVKDSLKDFLVARTKSNSFKKLGINLDTDKSIKTGLDILRKKKDINSFNYYNIRDFLFLSKKVFNLFGEDFDFIGLFDVLSFTDNRSYKESLINLLTLDFNKYFLFSLDIDEIELKRLIYKIYLDNKGGFYLDEKTGIVIIPINNFSGLNLNTNKGAYIVIKLLSCFEDKKDQISLYNKYQFIFSFIYYLMLDSFEKYFLNRMRPYVKEGVFDSLTGLLRKKIFFSELEKLLKLGKNIGLILIDIDNFKLINDNFSHLVGDIILEDLGKSIRKSIRGGVDQAGRYGGEEFTISYQVSDKNDLLVAAKSIISRLYKNFYKIIKDDSRVPIELKNKGISFSGGIVYSYEFEPEKGIKDFFSKADYRLYYAKRNGKGRVTLPNNSFIINPNL